MSEKTVQLKTCHGCGLESADDCPKQHIPSLEDFPCSHCLRSPYCKSMPPGLTKKGSPKDYWNECWTLDENKAFIER